MLAFSQKLEIGLLLTSNGGIIGFFANNESLTMDQYVLLEVLGSFNFFVRLL